MRPKRGDVIEVDWIDIHEDATGNPREAVLARRKSVGLFWGWRNEYRRRVLVTTTTDDSHAGPGQEGYCAYPWSCVLGLKVIKREGKR